MLLSKESLAVKLREAKLNFICLFCCLISIFSQRFSATLVVYILSLFSSFSYSRKLKCNLAITLLVISCVFVFVVSFVSRRRSLSISILNCVYEFATGISSRISQLAGKKEEEKEKHLLELAAIQAKNERRDLPFPSKCVVAHKSYQVKEDSLPSLLFFVAILIRILARLSISSVKAQLLAKNW